MRRFIVSLFLLLVATSIAMAQPFTRRSSQPQHDGLKKYYEISNFRLGGKYDLADPSKWEFGGEGGTTLESLGGGKLRNGLHRDRHPAPQCGRRNHQCGRHQLLLFRRLHRYVRAVGQGYGAVRWRPIIGSGRPIDTDRYYVVMVDPLGTWGASKPSDGLGTQIPAIQLLRHGAGQLSPAARSPEGSECRTGHRRVDGRHADLRLGRHASGISCKP